MAPDHKSTFTMKKAESWSEKSVNVFDLLGKFAELQICKVELLDGTFRYDLPKFDQTMTPVGKSANEFIARRWTAAEVKAKGRMPKEDE